jgi:orotidine 5'-phosphate decarboxylase subfamily 1
MENLNTAYQERALDSTNPAARKLFNIMAEKKTNLALSNDETYSEKFLSLTEKIGPEIAVLKTHIDIINDFSPEITKELLQLSSKHNFLIFEDRKLADIGNTVTMQYTQGIYKIADWSNFVTVHALPGPGIIESIGKVMKEKKVSTSRGILLLAQMSSEGNLATGSYTKKTVEFANANKDVVAGYIGNGGDVKELRKLAKICDVGHAILTPGVQLQSTGDKMGQRYTSPEQVISAGSDCIIVGRGIYKADDPLKAAREYRKAGWDAYLKRTKGA